MTLLDVVRDLDALEEDATIYAAEPWTAQSAAVVAPEPEAGGVPDEARAQGLAYFIEVAIAREFLDGWIGNLGEKPSLQRRLDRLVHYAVWDA